jgi:iron complex outermembrane recepter protein
MYLTYFLTKTEQMKRLFKKIFFTWSIGLLALGCQHGFAQGTGSMSGNISSKGENLSGAVVQVEGSRVIVSTDGNGNYSLSITAGTYTVKVSFAGMTTLSESVTVVANTDTRKDFAMVSGTKSDAVTVVGSRSTAIRSSTSSPAPVDVFVAKDLIATGQVEPGQMLHFVAPSFNSNRQTIADGTDHIDPATLRGLGPDQVLVLMNGRRRHNTALLNVNGTIGRGSVGTDLNAIPTSAIEKIEILRDGAAAQYGSDAIAGVVNIVLKKSTGKTSVNLHLGQFYEGDGATGSVGINHGFKVGKTGYLNASLDTRYRGATNRVGTYDGFVYTTSSAAADNALIATNGFSREKNMQIGNSQLVNLGTMLSFGSKLNESLKWFGTAGLNYRKGEAAGFYRYPRQTSQVILAKYPNGFLPEIHSTIYDYNWMLGLEGSLKNGWQWDASNTFGKNSFQFDVKNSNNASQFALGAAAQSDFDAGQISFSQNTFNFNMNKDFGKKVNLESFNVAFGVETRTDRYRIKDGEEASWKNYDPASGRVGGSQVFPGFQPANKVKESRNVFGMYLDFETDITKKFLIGVAGRVEDYSDYGTSVAGKVTARYKIDDLLTLRGAFSNGFRAPSLHQRFFSTVATVFTTVSGNLEPRQQGTFRNNSKLAESFGIPSLAPETSKNLSFGFTSKIGNATNITFDWYRINIDNRIVYTAAFDRNDPNAARKTIIQGLLADYPDVNSAAFFTNAVSTVTKGLDIVANTSGKLGKGRITITAALNFTKTLIDGPTKTSDKLPSDLFAGVLFNVTEVGRIEWGQPREKQSLNLKYTLSNWTFNFRNTYFGQVRSFDPNPILNEIFGSKVISDLSAGYKFKNGVQLTAGANNLFNVYPDALVNPGNRSNNRFIYSRNATQFGFNGGYYFVSATASF